MATTIAATVSDLAILLPSWAALVAGGEQVPHDSCLPKRCGPARGVLAARGCQPM
jgi:hypothetical protein